MAYEVRIGGVDRGAILICFDLFFFCFFLKA